MDTATVRPEKTIVRPAVTIVRSMARAGAAVRRSSRNRLTTSSP